MDKRIDLSHLLAALRDAPESKSESFVKCLCRGPLRENSAVRKYSGVVNYSELLCPECKREFSVMARVVCCRCRRLVGFVKPYVDRVTKFEMKPATHYHVFGCPSCSKTSKTPVMEHEQWCKARGVPTTENLDLIQEIEQKRLRIEAEAVKLRGSLTGVFSTPSSASTSIL